MLGAPLQKGGFSGGTVAGDTTFSGNVIVQGTLDVTGVATFTTTVTGSGNIMAGAAFAVGFTGRGQFASSADGIINVRAAAGTTGSSLAMASDKVVTFSSTTDPAGTVDTSVGRSAAGVVGIYSGTAQALGASLALASDKAITFSSTTDPDGTVDLSVGRSAAGVLGIYGGTGTTTGSSVALASDKSILFSGTTDPDGARTAGIRVRAAGFLGLFGSSESVGCHLGFASDKLMGWSSDTDPDTAGDTHIGRSAAAVFGLYGSLTSNGSSLALASDKQIQWSSNTDPDTAYDNAIIPVGAAVLKPITASAAAGDFQAPKSIITAGTMTATATVQSLLRLSLHKFSWTNAMVVALGAAVTGDVTVGTLPAKFVVKNVYFVVTGQAAGVTTLTGAVGRTGAGYIDYVVASDLKAAANTMYGVTDATRGTNQTPTKAMDLPSYTATTDVKMHFISTVENLDQTTGSTGDVFIEGYVLS